MLVLLMFSASFAGCFGEGEDSSLPGADLLSIEVEGGSTNNSMTIPGGEWVSTTFKADADMSVFIPYFIQDPGSLRAQNGTVLDLRSGEEVTIKVLFPPRNDDIVLLMGKYGRENWPIRAADESWMMWHEDMSSGSAIMASENEDGGGILPWIIPANDTGGDVVVKHLSTVRDQRDDLSEENGVGASGGWLNGRDVYEWVDFITDETSDPTDLADGAVGYLDRWIGNGNPAYEDAITYFEGVMVGYGLDVDVHRFQSGTLWAVNICGYKTGTV
jgi:hypothetical protein